MNFSHTPNHTNHGSTAGTQPGRTPAQAEASRRNGARGHGPVTTEGKEKSKWNALRHGAYARRVAPREDFLHEASDFQEYLAGLREEFNPQTTLEATEVSNLALLLVRRARVQLATGALSQPTFYGSTMRTDPGD